jgi:hypothetical protein
MADRPCNSAIKARPIGMHLYRDSDAMAADACLEVVHGQ